MLKRTALDVGKQNTESFYETPFGKEGMEIQNNLAVLGMSFDDLLGKYALTERQLQDFLYGKPKKADKGKFFNIYYDLENAVDIKRSGENKRELVHLLKNEKPFEKKNFYKLLRNILGVSQRQLAEMLNISINTVQKWEQGLSRARGGERLLLYMLIPQEIKEGKANPDKRPNETKSRYPAHFKLTRAENERGYTYLLDAESEGLQMNLHDLEETAEIVRKMSE